MSVRRVVVVFDNQARPETTGTYCLRALQQIVEVEHYLPGQLGKVPLQGVDLYLNIDDGLRYSWPADLHPCAFWAIDTHLDFQRCLDKSHDFDLVFAAQQDGTFRLRDEGISTQWLPLACDPEMHRRHEGAKTFDVCFVGNLFPGPRLELVQRIQGRYPRSFVGQRYFDDMARTYSASRIVFNRSIENDINMRVFEALACGSLLLTNDLTDNGQAELFLDGRQLATYRDAEQLLDKIAFYLQRETLREQIAEQGRQEVLAKHTYRHRMEQLLEAASRTLASRTVAVASAKAAEPSRPAKAPAAVMAVVDIPDDDEPKAPADPAYFDFARPELLALVPAGARRVLDIGCGAGRLGEAIKTRQTAEVVGIEKVGAAAQTARTRLDQVLEGDLERMDLPFAPQSFDAIVCGDVLEHLVEPERLLERARTWLRPGGQLIASIPNVRHHSVVGSLLAGNWTYEPAGLLDRTHLQFFTRRAIEGVFAGAGFTITKLGIVPGPGYEEWQRQGRPGSVKAGQLYVEGLPVEEAEEFYVYQYLLTAEPKERKPDNGEPKTENGALRPAALTVPQVAGSSATATQNGKAVRPLRILHLGDFGSSWRHETLTANALEKLGHSVTRLHEYLIPSVAQVLREANSGRYDCLLFYKGRIGASTPDAVFDPQGEAIAEVIGGTKLPCYSWYVDRALGFDMRPGREAWMRRVAPLCRVVFIADAALCQTGWGRWHVLREPIDAETVRHVQVAEAERLDLAFIGEVYGSRAAELAPVEARYPVHVINGVYGAELSPVLRRFRIILGPRYPTVPGFWGNRVYVVLGHGGFFLAPEVAGMREEGILPGVHYAPLGNDPVAEIGYWLARPEERERIALAGQELVLKHFTYEQACRELCRVIAETL